MAEFEVKTIKKVTAQIEIEVPEDRGNSDEDLWNLIVEKANSGEKVLSDELVAEIDDLKLVHKSFSWTVNGVSTATLVFEGIVE